MAAPATAIDFTRPTAPNQDKRWKLVDATMRRLGQHPRGLIETLHTVQETFGYLDNDALKYVAASLRVPLSRAYGVATFYHFFSLKPAGEHTCVVCMGTACYIKGAPQLLDAVQNDLGVEVGETTADGKVSLLTARCLGSCGLAPAVVYDRDVAGKVSPQLMRERLAQWRAHES
ncbi:MAG TPA: bidirectional hydrogenase complex protein HoxE [Terriglobales bacterium]|nr:bidirectional hydrogenase complex protein HoxE [Terriglobales bacterium]